MRKYIFYPCLLLAISFTVFSCIKDDTNIEKIKQDVQNALLQIQTVQGVDMNIKAYIARKPTVVPAGSNNALVQALKDAGDDGIVYLRSGLHTETAPIDITKRVIILGEDGAILKIKSEVGFAKAGVTPLNAAIHVLNAPKTIIQNVEIYPVDTNGGTAVLFENSDLSAVLSCTFKQFQLSVVLEQSNQICIIDNKINGSTLWQSLNDPTLFGGIFVINGKNSWISGNDVANAFMGIFVSDKSGSVIRNKVRKGHGGYVLCSVHPNTIKLPTGGLTGSRTASSNWVIRNNESYDNLTTGYLIIDNANNNILEGNTSTGNPLDYEMAGDTRRIGGVLALATYNNILTADVTQTVKNCGNNNTVVGGILVDLRASPCN